jgi:hypothetical protein
MTREVTDGKKYRLVFAACLFKGFVAPRIPIDWIVGMQEKVGTLGVNEAVGVTILLRSRARLRRSSRIGLGSDLGSSTRPFASVNRGREGKKQCASAKQSKPELSILPGSGPTSYAPALVSANVPTERVPARSQGFVGSFFPSGEPRLLPRNRFLRHCSDFPSSAPGPTQSVRGWCDQKLPLSRGSWIVAGRSSAVTRKTPDSSV